MMKVLFAIEFMVGIFYVIDFYRREKQAPILKYEGTVYFTILSFVPFLGLVC